MKKLLNKRGGFTLAELLIVIAIIAILIAIAIPAFGGALDNAKRQTDHANMRSAYAIAQVINLNGYIDKESIQFESSETPTDVTDLSTNATYYFMPNGKIKKGTTAPTGAYKLKVESVAADCTESIVCSENSGNHKLGYYIIIEIASGKVTVKLSAS